MSTKLSRKRMQLRLIVSFVAFGIMVFALSQEIAIMPTLPLRLFGSMTETPILSCLKLRVTRVADGCLASESWKPDGYGYWATAKGESDIVLGTTDAGYFRSEKVERNAVVTSISVLVAPRGAPYFSKVADSLSFLPLFRCSYQTVPLGPRLECFSIRKGERVAAQLFAQPRGDSGVVVVQEYVGRWKTILDIW